MRTIQIKSTICYGQPVVLEVDLLPSDEENGIFSESILKIFLVHPQSNLEFAQSIYDTVSSIKGEWERLENEIFEAIKNNNYISLDGEVTLH